VIEREQPPALESDKRAASLEIVEERYGEADARRQASRCLRCNVNTVFDTEKCVACNGCVDVCPENLIALVALAELAEEFADIDPDAAVMLKDETTCIRCSLCASRCPTQAVVMKRFDFYRECISVATRNPKVLYAG
jgi:ferredoxin